LCLLHVLSAQFKALAGVRLPFQAISFVASQVAGLRLSVFDVCSFASVKKKGAFLNEDVSAGRKALFSVKEEVV